MHWTEHQAQRAELISAANADGKVFVLLSGVVTCRGDVENPDIILKGDVNSHEMNYCTDLGNEQIEGVFISRSHAQAYTLARAIHDLRKRRRKESHENYVSMCERYFMAIQNLVPTLDKKTRAEREDGKTVCIEPVKKPADAQVEWWVTTLLTGEIVARQFYFGYRLSIQLDVP